MKSVTTWLYTWASAPNTYFDLEIASHTTLHYEDIYTCIPFPISHGFRLSWQHLTPAVNVYQGTT